MLGIDHAFEELPITLGASSQPLCVILAEIGPVELLSAKYFSSELLSAKYLAKK